MADAIFQVVRASPQALKVEHDLKNRIEYKIWQEHNLNYAKYRPNLTHNAKYHNEIE